MRSAMLLSVSVFALGGMSVAAKAQTIPCPGTESRVVECRDFRKDSSNGFMGNIVSDAFCDRVGVKPVATRTCEARCPAPVRSTSDDRTGDGFGEADADPLVFDLDGNGISLVSADDGVMFDIDNDGNPDKTGWVDPNDGLLAIDKNSDGIINNQSELFGTEKVGAYAHLAKSDTNEDGVIDDQDAIWSHLKMWVDSNSNGISEEHELKTMGELQMTSIDLNYQTVDEVDAGNKVTGIGGFTRAIEGVGNVVSKVIETFFSFLA